MGWEEAFCALLFKSFCLLAWPPFSLLYSLYFSVRAMESGSSSSYKRCLTFWVLFSLFMIMEWGLAALFNWLPWWPHVKSISTILLLMPYFGAAPSIYKLLIKHYCFWDQFTTTLTIFSQKSTHLESGDDDVTDQRITSQIQEKNFVAYQGTDDLAGCDNTESSYSRLTSIHQVQKEWSCDLCQISTTSGNCLREHLKGKKHTSKEEEPRMVQKEWSCALCQISTTSENCIRTHLKGKKHMSKEEELRMVQKERSRALCQISTTSENCLSAHLRGKKHMSREEELRMVQKEWSCALCQLSTTSENCLSAYLKGKKHKSKKDLLASAQERIAEMVLNQLLKILSSVSRPIRLCEWTKPEFGWTKLNTDGSIQRENASLGGLLRDYRGKPICAFVSKVHKGDIFLVELWAIWRGLVLALDLGVKVIWVESDSLSVVNTVNKKQSCPKASSYFEQIWELLEKFDKYKISHSWRETNRAADHLAKMVLRGNDVVLWPVDFPLSLCDIIKDDAEGKKYIRQ